MVAAVRAAPAPPLQRGLPPVLDAATRVLILGSFPGVASLAARQYYAHPRNHFWPLLGALLDLPLADLTYERRLSALRARRIGLWDSIVRCARAGSADAAIRREELVEIAPGAIDRLQETLPQDFPERVYATIRAGIHSQAQRFKHTSALRAQA